MDAWNRPGFFLKPGFDREGGNPADMVVLGARVLTCDEGRSRAQAVAVKDGRFLFVGDNNGAREFIGAETVVINARGRMLTPGFVDNHCHVLWISALQAVMSSGLFECESLDEVYSVVRVHARDNPDLPFVLCLGFRYDYIPGALPDKGMLDAVIPDRPTILWCYGGQSGWLNTMALELMRERNPVAFDRLGPYRDEKTGELTGLCRHFHEFDPFLFFPDLESDPGLTTRMKEKMREALEEAVSVGVTTMDDVQIYRPFIPVLLEFRDEGGLDGARVRCCYYVGHSALEDEDALRGDLDWWKGLGESESGPNLLFGRGLKFYIDGISGNFTAFMLEPYPDRPGDHGDPVWSQEDFDRVIEIADGMGLQTCTHWCGDAGVRRIVNACEHAQRVNGRRDSRHRVEHGSIVTREDQERMARLGVHLAAQPAHFFALDDAFERSVGLAKMSEVMPWRSLEKKGVPLSFGSDWCNSPLNPFYGLLLAATRMNRRMETNWAPEEKISLENAVRHWTIDSARALFMEEEIGSIEVGKRADFVIFTQNLLKIASPWFLLTHKLELGALDGFVDRTFVDGREVYSRSA
ncbi:MAG: amidohydrolase family protein [Actinobacteria bacterium]|nr:amidohydrolase family protein [Actinomycetota bacterium]MBU1944233.1 amidohydrolase family protein [Actinomycetota bacterium]MBU2688374.1 amidohydrolase family protein [Actinomycetota bacterium]